MFDAEESHGNVLRWISLSNYLNPPLSGADGICGGITYCREGGIDIEYYFECPACDLSVNIDKPTYEILLENGCILCEAIVTDDAFVGAGNRNASPTPNWIE